MAVRANANTSPRSPIYYFSSAKRRQFLDLDFFFLMSCHHGDRIGNSFSDNIAVRPFVELFA